MPRSWTCAAGLSLALAAGALAQEAQPSGWYLEEFESSGINDLFLYWQDTALGAQMLQINCQEGFGDVVVSAFIDPLDSDPTEILLADGDTQVALDFVGGGAAGGRYSVGGVTSFSPEVMDIITGQFSVIVDGIEQGRYSAKAAAEKFERMAEACPAG